MKAQEKLKDIQKKINKLNLKAEYIKKGLKKSKCYDLVKLEYAIKRVYPVVCFSKGTKLGYRINVPVCFANKYVKLEIVKK